MPIRLLGLIFAGALLASCAGADLPGFADSAVTATTGVNPQERLEQSMDSRIRARELQAEQDAAEAAIEVTAADVDTRSLAGLIDLYSNWSVLLVAGDYRTTQGTPTDAFDNARRAMADNLHRLGFSPENTEQLSVRPERYGDPRVHHASYDAVRSDLRALRDDARDGCFIYFTSHGAPEGVVLGEYGFLAPGQLNEILDTSCGTSPTIVIVSACYSGVFASGDMLQSNRMIITASRSDRSSFGCGEDDRFPYFDACLFQNFPHSSDWVDFARRTIACVSTRESVENLTPPSAPQVSIGEEMRAIALSPFIAVGTGSANSGS